MLRRSPAAPVRLLLLARSAPDDAGWWSTLRAEFADLCGGVAAEPLAALEPADSERAHTFRRVAADLADAWARVSPEADWPALAAELHPPADLADDRYALALTLHTRALTDLLQAGPRPVADAGPSRGTSDVLLDHEQRYWTDTAKIRDLHPRYAGSLLRRAVVAAVLCGAATEDEAIATIGRIPRLTEESEADRLALAEWLRDLYPAPAGTYWGALAPDRIAEHLTGQALRPVPAGRPELAADLLAGALPSQLRLGLTVLARAAVHQHHVPALLAELVTAHPHVSSAATSLAVDDLTTVVYAFPDSSVDLAVAAARLTDAAVTRLRPDPTSGTPPAEYLRLLNNLSNRLADLGRREEALAAIEEATAAYRELARARPDASRPDLAGSLNTLSNRLADLGRRDEALTAVEEAVNIRRDLYERYPGYFALPFARSLTLTGRLLRGSGSTHAMLRALLEALAIASEHQLQEIGGLAASLLRDERRAIGALFDEAWQEITGTAVPDEF